MLMPMMEKIVQTAKQTVNEIVESHRALPDEALGEAGECMVIST